MQAVAQIYFLIFWIPAVVSGAGLWLAWSGGYLRRPMLFLLWFVAALLLQLVAARFSPGWAIGLFLQAILAVYLTIRRKLDA